MDEYINREDMLEYIEEHNTEADWLVNQYNADWIYRFIDSRPTADVVEVDKVAEMLRLMFDDDCACNYNSNDEWLPLKCKYAPDECPMPKERLGCWKEFVKHYLAKMDGERNEA